MHFNIITLLVTSLGVSSVTAVAYQKTSSSSTKATSTSKTSSAQPSASQCKGFQQRNANFDDLTAVPGTAAVPVQDPYMGLNFQAFDLVGVVQTNAAPGVLPHSPPNYAGTGLQGETLGGTPMLTTNYPNSNTSSFSLQNFFFGCTDQAGNGAAAVPAACNIAIAGYQGNDNSVSSARQVCSQQFQYNPSTSTGPQQMAYSGAVNGCSNVQFVIIQFSPPGGSAATAPDLALVIDDVRYSTCST